MLNLHNIRKAYGNRIIYDEASLQVGPRERVALIGPNGSGKTTLFEIIAGRLSPDDGGVQIRKDTVVGYLPQEIIQLKGRTILEEVLSVSSEITSLEHRMAILQQEMKDVAEDEMENLLTEYGELQHRFEAMGGYQVET
ncbi:MAG: ATP-binding cassette domain-containing protein, partial [Nitrospira sp.]|nr:ATP-binding cassette domain-containing protein [Nitrospira sp.]